MNATATPVSVALEAARAALPHDPAVAAALLRAALQAHPHDADLHATLGHTQRLLGEIDQAEASLRTALALQPAHDEAAASLAHLLRNEGRYRAAADTLCANFATRSRDGDQLQATLDFLRECGGDELALALAEAHMAGTQAHVGASFARAELLFAAGRFDDAARALRHTLSLQPSHAGALLRLAHAQRFRDGNDADATFLRSAPEPATREARIALAFARGKVLDDLDDPAAAFERFNEGNRLAREGNGWSASAWSRQLAARIAGPSRSTAPRDDDAPPLFIVGMPRSGTTLLASRLARHADIAHRGEMNALAALAPLWRAAPTRENATRLARHFRVHLRRDDPPARWYLDKNPLNFRDLDALAALFPQARVIWCRRDARDVCLSIWMQHFAHSDCGFAYALPDIARYHADHARAMATWPARLGLDLRIVDYERFVAEPEAELAALWHWLGLRRALPRDDVPLSPQAARTASAWQVRQPIHRDAQGRWRRYVQWLPALRDLDPSGLNGDSV